MNIKKQIALSADDLVLSAENESGSFEVSFKVGDLNALVISHTKLLEAVKAYLDRDIDGGRIEEDALYAAIEEAEKLESEVVQ